MRCLIRRSSSSRPPLCRRRQRWSQSRAWFRPTAVKFHLMKTLGAVAGASKAQSHQVVPGRIHYQAFTHWLMTGFPLRESNRVQLPVAVGGKADRPEFVKEKDHPAIIEAATRPDWNRRKCAPSEPRRVPNKPDRTRTRKSARSKPRRAPSRRRPDGTGQDPTEQAEVRADKPTHRTGGGRFGECG